MIKLSRFRLIGVCLLLILFPAYTLMATEFRRIGQDYRSLAMGNTGIASANSNSALFYNPAAMANIFEWWVNVIPTIQINYSDEAQGLVDSAISGTTPSQASLLTDYMGKHPFVKIDGTMNFFMNMDKRGMTIGANYNYEATLDIEVQNPLSPNITYFSRVDDIKQVGISFPVGMGQWIVGASYKLINREDAAFTYGAAEIANGDPFPNPADYALSGAGGGFDIGFLYRMASRYRIQIGGVYRSAIALRDAEDIPEEIALGIAMTTEFTNFRITAAMDWRDITNQLGSVDDTSINKRLHYGIEIGYLPITKTTSTISLRTGFNQGYLADGNYLGFSGIEVAFGKGFVLGYTKYTEEIGEYAGQTPSNRTMLYLSIGF